jgi:hypothetical protein
MAGGYHLSNDGDEPLGSSDENQWTNGSLENAIQYNI